MIHLCIILQVDNTPPLVSRSSKPIDMFPSGPISSIGNNAPTLAAIMHRGVRLKKVTTKRTQMSSSVAASTLAQAFKVYLRFLYRFYSYICQTCTYEPFFLYQHSSASARTKSKGADAPQSSQQKRKGAKSNRAQTKRQRVATVGYFKRKQKNPQAHGYRCSFHPGVFQSINFPQGT